MVLKLHSRTLVVAGAAAVVLIAGCGQKKQQESSSGTQASSEPITNETSVPAKDDNSKAALCVFDKTALKAEPNKAGKWLASVALGEKLEFAGDSAVDSGDKDRVYYKVTLSDGKQGWVSSWGVIIRARAGMTNKNAPLYSRPDILTYTQNKVPFMSMVAVTEDKGEWVQIVGEGRKISGWMKTEDVAADPNDVGAAMLASKLIKAKGGMASTEAIEEAVNQSPFPESYFIKALKDSVAVRQSAATAIPVSETPAASEPITDSALGAE